MNKKTASKGASRKYGATPKKRTRKRSDAKRRKAPASRGGPVKAKTTKEERELAKAARDADKAAATEAAADRREADRLARLKKQLDDKMARIEEANAAAAAREAKAAQKEADKRKRLDDRAAAREAKKLADAEAKRLHDEARMTAAEAKRLEWASQEDITDLVKEKARRLAYRISAQSWPREVWVKDIKDPKQRALASAAADVCAIFGIPPEVLRADRKDQSPRSRNENSFRGVALGAVIDVGIAIGLGWNEMHTHPDTGRSEVIDLPPHAATIRGAHERWAAAQTMDGIAIEVARQRVALIRTAAVKAAAVGK